MLQEMSSRDVAEWIEFDAVYGLTDRSSAEVLGQIQEQLQLLNYMFAAANSQDENSDAEGYEPPVPAPKRYPRPWDYLYLSEDEEEDNITE
ncbi:hypothetical protein [Streptomyces sp. NPDC055085]